MVDRQLIKRILGQRTLAQSLLARHTLGVSGEMPGHPAFVAALAVIAPPAASATVFEQTPLDDSALAAFFAAPAAEQPPPPELRMQPAPVAPAQVDERAEIGALPAAAPNPLDQQRVRLPNQPQIGRQVAEQAEQSALQPDTFAEPTPQTTSELYESGAGPEQAHPQAFADARTSQAAALPQVRPPAPAAPESGAAQQAGTAVPARIAESPESARPVSPSQRSQPATAATGDPYIDMVNKVRAARMPKGPIERPRVPLGQRLNEARDFDRPVDLSQAVSRERPHEAVPAVPAQPAPAVERSTQPWDDAEQAGPPAAQPAPDTLPLAVEQTQPALPLARPEPDTNAAVPTTAVPPGRAADPPHLPSPVAQADRATLEQQAEPAPGPTQATRPAALAEGEPHAGMPLPAVPSQPGAGHSPAPEGVPASAQPAHHAADVRPVQRQEQGERVLAEQTQAPAETAAPQTPVSADALPAPLPNEPRGPSTAPADRPTQPQAVPTAAGEHRQPLQESELAVAPDTGARAEQPRASGPPEQPPEPVPAGPPISRPVPDLAGAPQPIEAQAAQDTGEQGVPVPTRQPGTPRAEAPQVEHLDHIDPSQVDSGVPLAQAGLERQPGQAVPGPEIAANDRPGVPVAAPVAPDTHMQHHEQRETHSEPVAEPAAAHPYAPAPTPDQPPALVASDQTIAPQQAPVRVPPSEAVVTPERPSPMAAQPEAAVQPAPAAGTPAAWAARMRRHEQANVSEAPEAAESVTDVRQAQPEASTPGPAVAGTPVPVEPVTDARQAQPEASTPAPAVAGTPAAWAARMRRHEQANASEAPAPAEPIAGLPQATAPEARQAQPEASTPTPAVAGRPAPVEPVTDARQAQPEASTPAPAVAGRPAPVESVADARQAQPEASTPAPAAGTPAAWAARMRRHEQANVSEAPAPAEPIAGLPQATAPEARQAQPEASTPAPAVAGRPAPVESVAEARQAQPEASTPTPAAAGTPAAWAARMRRHEHANASEAPAPAEPIADLQPEAQNRQVPGSVSTQAGASVPAPAAGTPAAWAARMRRHETMQQPQSPDRTAVQPGVVAGAPAVGAPPTGIPATQAAPFQQHEAGTPISIPGPITPSGDVSRQGGQPQPRPQTPIAQAPLRESSRRFLKPIIGRDPADVRVYRGAAADQLAARYAADALTDGASVVLAADESEATPRALGLLAHELAHVEQAARFVAPQTATERNALERAARHVEAQAVHQARAEREQLWQASPASSPVVARPVAAVSPARPISSQPAPGEQWNGLPAPWEPLPDDVFAPQQPPFAPETRAMPAAQHSSSPATPIAAHTQAARPGAAHPGASGEPMLAEHSRIQPSESAVEPAQQDAPAAPEPDLDALARQVYQVIKQRLAAERRRGRS